MMLVGGHRRSVGSVVIGSGPSSCQVAFCTSNGEESPRILGATPGEEDASEGGARRTWVCIDEQRVVDA